MVSEIIRKVRGRDSYVVLLDDEMEEIKACDLVPLFKKIKPPGSNYCDFVRRIDWMGEASSGCRDLLSGHETG